MVNHYSLAEVGNRKWGFWEVLDSGSGFCMKRLKVNPRSSLSKQKHFHRAETWIVVAGNGSVLIEDTISPARVGDVFYIPMNAIHQLLSGAEGIEVIELQKGEILDENDIVRYS